ncbi:hypothetical protein Glove_130g146 [Diversispora epigaea]|uniref:Uncharacterized protein n=1 Tax=Diversispora epigaea TaxID=1348612 RepID=A0A397J0V2_9GLOM|nr:hypothetical protein Glove_130g146 [Diversispora epigaea]
MCTIQEATYLTVLLLATCYAFTHPATIPKNKVSLVLGLVVSLTSLLTICYCIWLWATIRWKLPGQECGDKVMVFWVTRSFNPTGWARDFILVILCIILLPILWNNSYYARTLMTLEEREEPMTMEEEEEGKAEEPMTMEEEEEGKAEEEKNRKKSLICKVLFSVVPTSVLIIVSAEILLQRNPISKIQGNWNVEGIVILIMAVGDAISTIYLLLKYTLLHNLF